MNRMLLLSTLYPLENALLMRRGFFAIFPLNQPYQLFTFGSALTADMLPCFKVCFDTISALFAFSTSVL